MEYLYMTLIKIEREVHNDIHLSVNRYKHIWLNKVFNNFMDSFLSPSSLLLYVWRNKHNGQLRLQLLMDS